MKPFTNRIFKAGRKLLPPYLAVRACGFRPALIFPAALLLSATISTSVYAQGKVQGTISDENGTPLPGVSILIKGTQTGTQTDANGKFTINANSDQTLTLSMIGYTTMDVPVGTNGNLTIKLTPVASTLNQVVVVGYNTQKKVALTGAVSSVSSAEILTTKNENILNTLTGKIPGLRVVQNTSEPGSFNNSFDIRGMGNALIVIDGIPRPDIARVDPNDVESISVLKDASAAIYGVRAANGVILITTKKGKPGSLELNYNGVYGYQVPVSFSKSVDAIGYMTLLNEQRIHNAAAGVAGTPLYTQADFDAYNNGTKTSTDWNAATVNKSAAQQQHSLSATGGTEKSSYFISLGYTNQDGILKSGDLFYNKYNLRSNISSKISQNLNFDLNLSGIMDIKNQPYQSPYWIFRSMWYQPPVNPIYANNNPQYFNSIPNPLHSVAQADADASGYQVLNNKFFQSSAALNYSAPFLKGLNIKGVYSFDYTTNNNKLYQKTYYLYNYNQVNNTYNGAAQQSPSTLRREFAEYPTSLGQIYLTYNHSFADTHNVNALLVYETSTRTADNVYGQRELSIPVDQLYAGNSANQLTNASSGGIYRYVNAAYIGSFAYDYKAKYFGKFQFRYDGSSRFTALKQWGFFPEAEVGWRVSEEGFFKNTKALSFISSLKFRGSYGLTGDDNTVAYQFLGGFNYPASGSATGQPTGAVFDGTFVNAVQNRGIPNPKITWYTSKTLDIGADLEAWNGKFGLTFDYFIRNRTGLLATSLDALADVVGAALPQQNINADRTQGFDFEVSHRNLIGQFGYNIKGTFGFTRTTIVTNVKAAAGNSYLNWINNYNLNGRYNNVYFGYGSNGQFENYAAIEHSPIYVARNTVVGDYRYEDWNGDGQIGSDDSHPIATTGLPLVTYGFNMGATYKGFDLNALFQGAAMVNASYQEQLREPLWAGGNALSQFLDRYHPVDPTADPYSPTTEWVPGYYAYTGTLPFINTLSNTHSAAYVRLKSAEFGYTLPKKWMGRSAIKNVRLYFTGYNLFTITSLKYLDPEHPSNLSVVDSQFGYAYPIDKIYSLGLNLKF